MEIKRVKAIEECAIDSSNLDKIRSYVGKRTNFTKKSPFAQIIFLPQSLDFYIPQLMC